MESFDKYSDIIRHFRANSRVRLTDLSKKTRIPVSTLFEKLKTLEEQHLIKKHTSLLNFRELGFDIRAQLLLKVEKTEELKTFLEKHQSVNNIFRINNGFDFLIEAIFENMSSFDKFFKDISTYNLKKSKEYFILEDIKREGFMEFNPILHANY